LTQDGRLVNGDGGDADPFRNDLKPDNELYTTRDMLSLQADSKKHFPVGSGRILLKLDNLNDIVIPLTNLGVGCGPGAKPAEYGQCLLVLTILDRPTRGFGHEINEDTDDGDEEDLDADRESPADLSIAITDKAETVFNPICCYNTEYIERKLQGNVGASR
jgi:hypothetical protein